MNYVYNAYLKTVSQFTPAAQKSQMPTSGWYKDEFGKFDDATNKGFAKRKR